MLQKGRQKILLDLCATYIWMEPTCAIYISADKSYTVTNFELNNTSLVGLFFIFWWLASICKEEWPNYSNLTPA